MKCFKILSACFLFFMAITVNAQDANTDNCKTYPRESNCCQQHQGAWVTDGAQNFCYLNLRPSTLTKSDCMEAGGYAFWRNDSTMLCIPKGTLVMTGNVSSVDESGKMITLVSEGETFTIKAPEMELPQSGVVVDMYYTVDPDGTFYGRTCHPIRN